MGGVHLEDASGFTGHADRLEVPRNEADLVAVLRDANAASTPITIVGAGTGVTGARVPQGGLAVSLERFMDLEIGRGHARVGAGALLRDVQAAAARAGQFYAPDPTENAASIGGTIATNASGSRSFRYGDTRAHILALRVALADGSIREYRRGDTIDFNVSSIRRPATTKNTAGYALAPGMDWIDLFVGSEGTLGIVTEARLHLLPAPGEMLTGVIFFNDDEQALDAVDQWRPRPRLRMLEYLDAGSLDLLRPGHPDIPSAARAAVLVEEEILDESVLDEWLAAAPEDSWFAAGVRDRERFRRFRHALPETVNAVVRSRGLLKMGTDFAVPIARNREMLSIYRERLGNGFNGRYVVFGHIGDAHLHVNILPRSGPDADRAAAVILELAREAVCLGGTVSAEHGLGKRKAHLLALQYSEAEIAAMRAVKRRLDPHWILGRGTLFPFRDRDE